MYFFLLVLTVFPSKGYTLFLLFFYSDSDFKIVKKAYPYEENALFFY